jgi:hypothetical protein
MKTAIAVIVASMIIAGALVFQSYEQRYQVAGIGSGLAVRIDTWSGKLSACTQVDTPLSTVAAAQMKLLTAAGFTSEEITKHFTDREGEMVCSRWGD